jgi:hypothetical protein
LVFATWVDDLLVCGEDRDLDVFEREIKSEMEIKAEPEFKEYLGNAITIKRDTTGLGEVKFTQPLLLQKLKDNCPPENNQIPRTPAAPGTELSKDESSAELSKEQAFKFRSLLATIMHMVQWSRPDILQSVRALARYMHAPREFHWRALQYLLAYMYGTLYRGLSLRPVRLWDGSEGYTNSSLVVDPTRIMRLMSMIGAVSQGAGLILREHQSCREAPLNDMSHFP